MPKFRVDAQSIAMSVYKGEDSDEERKGEEERGCQSSGVGRRKLCALLAEV